MFTYVFFRSVILFFRVWMDGSLSRCLIFFVCVLYIFQSHLGTKALSVCPSLPSLSPSSFLSSLSVCPLFPSYLSISILPSLPFSVYPSFLFPSNLTFPSFFPSYPLLLSFLPTSSLSPSFPPSFSPSFHSLPHPLPHSLLSLAYYPFYLPHVSPSCYFLLFRSFIVFPIIVFFYFSSLFSAFLRDFLRLHSFVLHLFSIFRSFPPFSFSLYLLPFLLTLVVSFPPVFLSSFNFSSILPSLLPSSST